MATLNVPQLSEKHPAFSQPSLRWLIFNAEKNGLAASGALIRVGRRVLIDEESFLRWLDAHRQRAA